MPDRSPSAAPHALSALLLAALPLLFPLPAAAQSVLVSPQTATYGNPWGITGKPLPHSNHTLITPSPLPPEGEYEVLGRVEVSSRWLVGAREAQRMLAEKAREMGANAVVEAKVWQDLIFPNPLAPHGSGIAVRIIDHGLVQKLTGPSSVWE